MKENIHDTVIDDSGLDSVGYNTTVWHFSHLCKGSRIGRNCSIGQNVYIGIDVRIGNGCRIQNNVYIPEGVEILANVFIGPSVTFTNVKYPRAESQADRYKHTTVWSGSTIGANAVILPGLTLGTDCMIGAGSVVTNNVEACTLVVGNPARLISRVCKCGRPFKSAVCECGKKLSDYV